MIGTGNGIGNGPGGARDVPGDGTKVARALRGSEIPSGKSNVELVAVAPQKRSNGSQEVLKNTSSLLNQTREMAKNGISLDEMRTIQTRLDPLTTRIIDPEGGTLYRVQLTRTEVESVRSSLKEIQQTVKAARPELGTALEWNIFNPGAAGISGEVEDTLSKLMSALPKSTVGG